MLFMLLLDTVEWRDGTDSEGKNTNVASWV